MGIDFPGDDNRVLYDIQFHTYREPFGVGLLCWEAERRYAAAIRLLTVSTELWEQIKRHDETYYGDFPPLYGELLIKRFDHRVLQAAYYTIAAAFRFRHRELSMPLFAEDENVKYELRTAWLTYWESEVKRLVGNDMITRAILTAVAFQNEEKGYAAENELTALLRSEYRDLLVKE